MFYLQQGRINWLMCVFTSGINVPLVREIGKLIYLRKVGNFLLCIIYQFDYLDDSISLCKNTYWSVIKNPSAARRANRALLWTYWSEFSPSSACRHNLSWKPEVILRRQRDHFTTTILILVGLIDVLSAGNRRHTAHDVAI